MTRSNPDKFVFHLHLNEIQSASSNPTVHIHLHFAPKTDLAVPTPDVQSLVTYSVEIFVPLVTPSTTPVRHPDPNTMSGSICARGRVVGSPFPDGIRAKVYHCESKIPTDPTVVPADATTGTLDDVLGLWFFGDGGDTHEINDVYNNDQNWLVVWAVNIDGYGVVHGVARTTRQIKGEWSQYTECQGYNASGLVGGGGPTAQVSAAPMPEILPWRYRSQFAGKFPGLPVTALPSSQGAADQSLLLQLDARQGAGAPVWQTPLPAGGDVDAMLRLTRFGSSFRGRLTITKIAGRLLDEPLSWKTDDWRLFEPNILAPVGPTALVSSNTTAIVEPT